MWEIWANLLLPKAFKKLPKVQKIAQSGHTARDHRCEFEYISYVDGL